MAPIACNEEGSSADSGNLGGGAEKLSEEELGTGSGGEGFWGLGREENIAPEGLFGFL